MSLRIKADQLSEAYFNLSKFFSKPPGTTKLRRLLEVTCLAPIVTIWLLGFACVVLPVCVLMITIDYIKNG